MFIKDHKIKTCHNNSCNLLLYVLINYSCLYNPPFIDLKKTYNDLYIYELVGNNTDPYLQPYNPNKQSWYVPDTSVDYSIIYVWE